MPKEMAQQFGKEERQQSMFFHCSVLLFSHLCVFLDPVLEKPLPASAGRFNRCLYCMFGLCFNCCISTLSDQ